MVNVKATMLDILNVIVIPDIQADIVIKRLKPVTQILALTMVNAQSKKKKQFVNVRTHGSVTFVRLTVALQAT